MTVLWPFLDFGIFPTAEPHCPESWFWYTNSIWCLKSMVKEKVILQSVLTELLPLSSYENKTVIFVITEELCKLGSWNFIYGYLMKN